jgi:hypothetical protein
MSGGTDDTDRTDGADDVENADGAAAGTPGGSGSPSDSGAVRCEPHDPSDETLLHTALMAAEDQLRRAMVSGDVVALGALLDDHVIYTGPDGRQVAKQQDLDAYATGAVEITAYEEQHRSVRVMGRTGITWVLTEVHGRAGSQNFGTRLRYTRTWVYDAGWRVVAAHASFAPPG